MFKRIVSAALLAAALLPIASLATTHRQPTTASVKAPVSDGTLHQYDSENAAQAHCPSDTVVWLNTRTGIWHEKGMRWYGATREGAYVCRKEAASAGDRDTRNGQ